MSERPEETLYVMQSGAEQTALERARGRGCQCPAPGFDSFPAAGITITVVDHNFAGCPLAPEPDPEDLPADQLAEYADEAVATNQIVTAHDAGLVIVPDTIIAETVANGHPAPADGTAILRHPSGRTAYAYLDPRVETTP